MKKWIGVALIGIMFFSTIAFAIIQSFSVPQQPPQQEVQLPLDYVIDYKMTQMQFDEAVSRGVTVATYKYESGCAECASERALLEQIVTSPEFQGQIILEEVQESGSPKLEIRSFAGERSFETIGNDQIVAALCELVVNPPLGCIKVSGNAS